MSRRAKERTASYGRQDPSKTKTSISLSRSVLQKARQAAKADGRSLSNWLELQLKEWAAKQETEPQEDDKDENG